MLNLEKVSYQGWPNCLRLSNDKVELIATTDVGPRIIHFGWKGQDQNLFYINPATAGKTGGEKWNLYGGHRLWHAPEIKPRTYVPDNGPVAHDWNGQCLRLKQDREELTGLQKTIEILMHEDKPGLSIHHQIANHGPWDAKCAPWALSVLAGGGTAIIPQEPFIPFPDALLPARPMVLWHYTDMTDPRFTWGKDFIQLRQDAKSRKPVKFGVRNSVCWGAYVLGDTIFLKQASLKGEEEYPDYGCNWELYTDSSFLELETLGPLGAIATGGMVEHVEEWTLLKADKPQDMDATYEQIVAHTKG